MKQFITEAFVLQQDTLWFLAVLALAGALLVVMRSAADRSRYEWAAWVIGGFLAMALAELVAIALAIPPPHRGPPNLPLDLLLGVVLGLQVWGVLKPAGRAGRSAFWLLLLVEIGVFAGLRHAYPWTATLVLCALATGGIVWRAWTENDALERQLAWVLVPGLWLSSIGPATAALNNWIISQWFRAIVIQAPREDGQTFLTAGLRRWSTVGTWGSWAPLLLFGGGCLCAWLVVRRRWPQVERDELWRFLRLTLVWVAAGLALAVGLGWRAKRDFEAAQKQQVSLAAKLLVPGELAAAFGPVFDPHRLPGRNGRLLATVSRDFQKAALPVRERMNLIQDEVSDDAVVYILTERNGLKLAGAVPSRFGTRSDLKLVLEPEPDFAENLHTKFLPPFHEAHGIVAQARAPLFFPDGSFLGWLVLEVGPDYWLAGQTQARLQALAIIGLGFGLALMGLRQRLRNIARDEALRAAEVARQADRTKTEFLARVSHELRTPIQSVLGYGELLQSAVQGDAARARLGALRQHGLLMLRLVNDLLDLGALQTGRFHLSPKPTRLFELVQQTVESMRPRAEAKGLLFHTVLAGTRDEWRLADGERLRQVVLNLVANAIKFTDTGSVQVTFAPNGADEFLLKVSDTGPGIPAGGEGKIFQPFARLESTAAKEGTGLGLVLAKALCESMGGGIALEPQVRGACFVARFRLPLAHRPADADLAPVSSLRGRRLLIVDDNTLIRELFSSYFQELGADCAVAADGPAALQLATIQAFDAIVLDLALPGMSGTEVARQLRVRVAPTVRIIGVSAHATAEDRAQALAAGMDAFLTKPVDLRTLVQEIENTRPKESTVSPQLAGLTERLRAQFRTEAPVLGAALAAAVAEGDWAQVRAKAHYLKNSADVLGLKTLADRCLELERAANESQPSAIVACAETCRAELQAWT